ncbi:hypothetical protein IVB14_25105 [Bradyrhizobium sp. 180]|nr:MULTISPECIES: hypothetical protein [unclassified Bradyrhizobium]MCK1419921.1 hypothetical protein [Bradyrhizobium sp. CW12]MCK1493592.1 hypothetical protein [Bradyrhizobium sp. 180]MCK1529591.1 hypothetical protein [Bradyrhizobium sp. 182]MCK1593665.1 hypothetical protein [Bradyrhizobium sp. 164]MCK1616935.1 hypothetical protein [Bradyrhizobium sp. 159]
MDQCALSYNPPKKLAIDERRTLETLRRMRQDDDAVYRSINNICRGC